MSIYPVIPNSYIVKSGYAGCIPIIFLIFASKHRLWVLVRPDSVRRFYRVPQIYVLSKNIKNIIFFPMKFLFFTAEKNLCILHGQGFVVVFHTDDMS